MRIMPQSVVKRFFGGLLGVGILIIFLILWFCPGVLIKLLIGQ